MVKTRSSSSRYRETTTTAYTKCPYDECIGCRYCLSNTTPKTVLPTTPHGVRCKDVSIISSFVSPPSEAGPTVIIPSPKKSYAEALTGCPSPGLTRDHSSDDVNSETSVTNDTPSLLGMNVVTEISEKRNQIHTIPQTEPQVKTKKKRQKWSREQNEEIYICYIMAKAKLLPVIKGTYEIWRKRNPDLRPEIDANKLANQKRYAVTKMINSELKLIETNALKDLTDQDTNRPIDDIIVEAEIGIPNSTIKDDTENRTEVLDDNNTLKEKDTSMDHGLYAEILMAFEKYKNMEMCERKKPMTLKLTNETKEKLAIVNDILTDIIEKDEFITLTEINALHYSVAIVMAGETPPTLEKEKTNKDSDPTQTYINLKIEKIRKCIGRLTAASKSGIMTKKVKSLCKDKTTESTLVTYRMRLAAICKSARTKKSQRNRFQNNKMYRHNQKAFYTKLRFGNTAGIANPPPEEEIKKFWGDLFGNKASHNEKASWLEDERKEMKDKPKAIWEDTKISTLTSTTKRLANWKAPGLDQVQNFWLKHLKALHPKLNERFNDSIKNPELAPRWLTGGRTTLIYKKGDSIEAKNYRPITCLPTYYKLMTLILTDKIYEHTTTNLILPFEQKGVRRKARGCKDHLMLDKILSEDAKKKKRNLSMMWIDYKKAYDSIPHSWLTDAMKVYKIDEITIKFIQTLMPTWRTKIHLPHDDGCISTDDINIERGIFQGDSLSPLLFCICLIPITNILKRAKVGYKTTGELISHLLYMDDLKIYCKNAEEMERARKLIAEFSKDICMDFGLDKCAVVHITKGILTNSPLVKGIPLLSSEDNYKYLGIIQCDEIIQKEVKESTKKEYLSRVRNILKSDISAKNVTSSIKAFAMPIMRYGFGILKWTITELKTLDRKTRKILYKNNFHHPKSNSHRLYAPRYCGGRGLIGAIDCHRQECTAVAEYIRDNKVDPLVKIVRKFESKRNAIWSFLEKPKAGNTMTIEKEHMEELSKMKLHGQYFNEQAAIPDVNLKLSHQWLEQSHLRFETESLICAAQEQALNTRYIQKMVWKKKCSPLCRLCKEKSETVAHIVSGCKMLAANKYTFRHNQVATYLHWNIMRDRGFEVTENWLMHKPQESVTRGGVTITWDMAIITDKKVKCNIPDILIHDSNTRSCQIIDVAVPVCTNIVRKNAEKITKYRELGIELQKCWNLTEVKIIPVVCGALGTVGGNIEIYLKMISPEIKFNVIQKTVLLGTAHILRNFLT